MTDQMRAQMEQATEAWEQAKARRDTPEAREARLRSRSAHQGLSRDEALALAERELPGVFGHRWFEPLALPDGADVERFFGSHGALIKDGGDAQIVESLGMPLSSDVASGERELVDLRLAEVEGGFSPRNPVVPLRITPDGEALLPGSQTRIRVEGASSAPGPVVGDGRVFVGGALPDVDLVVAPAPAGVSFGFQVRSASAPEEAVLVFELPEDVQLRAGAGDEIGSVEAVAADGDVVARLASPAGWDADGERLKVSYTVDGARRVVVRFPHRDADLRYPLYVDPVYAEQYEDYGYFPAREPWAGWGAYANANLWSFSKGDAIRVANAKTDGTWYLQDEFGSWSWQNPQGYIAAVQGSYVSHDTEAVTCAYMGVLNSTWSYWKPGSWGHCYEEGNVVNAFPVADNYTNDPSYRDWVMFQLAIPMTGRRWSEDALSSYGARIWLDDNESPTVTGVSNSAGGAWVRGGQDVTVSPRAHDGGLGMFSFDAEYGGILLGESFVGSDGSATAEYSQSCSGPRGARCPNGEVTGAITFNTDDLQSAAGAFAEGAVTIGGAAYDILEKPQGYSTQLKVDRSAPSVSVSGALWDARGKRIHDGVYPLRVSASDPHSGAKSIDVRVDGRSIVDPADLDKPCTAGGCSLTRNWTFRPELYGVGEHTIKVIATDQIGNRTTDAQATDAPLTFTVKVNHAGSANVGPGSVSLLTGNLTVSRDDVSMPGYGSPLTVSRTYNSLDSPNGANGAFGPGWVSSLPVDEAGSDYIDLYEEPNGTAVLTDSSGEKYAFPRNTDGTYAKVQGLEDLTLTATVVNGKATSFRLNDAAGAETTFTKPAGTERFVPTAVKHPASGGSFTISYEVVNGRARPVEIMAPPPPGVVVTGGGTVGTAGWSDDSAKPGVRALRLVYADATDATGETLGYYAGRLVEVHFRAYDPELGAMRTDIVAEYEYDVNGRLRGAWDPRVSPTLKETYDYSSDGLLTRIGPPGLEPWTLTYANASSPTDPAFGRLKSVSRASLVASPATATTTVVYGVPVSGSGAPHQMAAGDVAAWGQTDVPAVATAVFPPDQLPSGDPPSDYSRATIYYLDAQGRTVNVRSPGGAGSGARITTTEYDGHDNVVRELTAANRERVLSGQPANELNTRRTYSADGLELREELGPMHQVKLDSGEVVRARRHTVTTYDEGAPATGGPYHLPTTVQVGAQVPGRTADADVRVTKNEYGDMSSDGHPEIGWKLRTPTATITDAGTGGLMLKHRTVYHSKGLVVEKRMPANPNGGDAHATRTVYYTEDANSSYPDCGGKIWWTNMPCKTLPVAQPGTAGMPDLPVTKYEYNRLNQVTMEQETVGSATRTSTTMYDAAGRKVSESVQASEGEPRPATTTGYSSTTGLPTTTSAVDGATTRTITRGYDTLGRITSYTDADANTSTTTYDLLGRPVTTTDGKGSQTRTYDPTSGLLTALSDSQAGSFSASYDPDGALTSSTLPNGLRVETTYDETGAPTRRRYTKTTSCSSNCIWLDDQVTESIHGQWLEQTTAVQAAISRRSYRYDGAGRLSRVDDTPTGKGCTVRRYAFDADSNRTSKTTHAPAADGTCNGGSTGTVEMYQYDAADRLVDPGVLYDSFGRQTAIPAAKAGGDALAVSYYVDDLSRSVSQSGVTKTFYLDPAARQRVIETAGGDNQRKTFHYADDSDSPAWTVETTNATRWSRNVEGIESDLAAIYDSKFGLEYQLTNLHGDVVAVVGTKSNAQPSKTVETDEFGVPVQTTDRRYGWLGGKQRRTETARGVIQMGSRVYVPAVGRFTAVDPVEGGSANDYDYANQDAPNTYDLDGRAATIPGFYSCNLDAPVTRQMRNRRLRVFFNFRCHKRSDIGKINITAQIRRDRSNWWDDVERQVKSRTTTKGARFYLDYDSCQEGKRYFGQLEISFNTRRGTQGKRGPYIIRRAGKKWECL